MARTRAQSSRIDHSDNKIIIPLETICTPKDIEVGMFADVTLQGSISFDGEHKFKKGQRRTFSTIRDIAYYWKRQSHFNIILYRYEDEEDAAGAKLKAKQSPVSRAAGVGNGRKRAIKRRR